MNKVKETACRQPQVNGSNDIIAHSSPEKTFFSTPEEQKRSLTSPLLEINANPTSNWLNRVLDLFNGNAVFLKLLGYSSANKVGNIQKRDVEAKKPTEKDFTSPNFVGHALPDLHKWPQSHGWVGLLIPNGYVAVDIHGIEDGELLTQLLDDSGYCYHAIRTYEGIQFIFRDSGRVIKKFTNVMTVSGFLVDYRIQMRDYIVLPAPNSYRYWERLADDELDQMPHWFNPLYQVSKGRGMQL